ncbi:DNA cytosine methyltransferase [Pectinatus haikarae]|uniref:DNA (cytosine-5-)-methyltransferase n=1 Tax=Pectinatus haikarae TaxID=349096 RepID=A0ABT9Y9F4_9FIRM|nr:DNA cytosine methyltransferase [Pectinatus haikarae]MDQ0204120.1 DNA (cytosine-5)-methyltransferase 1 [Pectinatus haikarae]
MYKTVDLFAGAGGLSYGFEATDKFNIIAVAENNANARKTYVANHRKKDDILMITDVCGYDFRALSDRFNGIDVVIGGPPCQGFSNVNRQKNHIISMNNSLVKEYFRAIKEIKPKAFVMENVSMLSSEKHRFYDSKKDHDEVFKLRVNMKRDELVIADENYDGVDCFKALNENDVETYSISNKLLKLLNVLYKDRKNKENRLQKYIYKNANIICSQIKEFLDEGHYDYKILHDISKYINTSTLEDFFDELGQFIKFQKSFRLIDELNSNDIIYKLTQNPETGKITALVNSYSVIDYANKILGDDYVKNSGVINAIWYGVPQERKRFIMIGIRTGEIDDNKIVMPDGSGKLPPIVNTGEAIMDLADYAAFQESGDDNKINYKDHKNLSEYAVLMRTGSSGICNHVITKTREKAQERFAVLHEGENFRKLESGLKDNYADPDRTQNSIYLRLDREKPSGTVINVRKSMWVHPTLNRAVSIREAARLQSFPDKFVFSGTKNSQYQQVGNAVPPLMAKGIAELLLKYL